MPKFITRTGRIIWCSRAEFLRRDNLPYGKWTCADGREVLFNRWYEPIYQRASTTAAVMPADPKERVPWQEQDYFYNDGFSEPRKRKAAQAALVEWRCGS